MKLKFLALAALLFCYAGTACADENTLRATYLANAGVMVEHGQSKILFDPLYRLNHDYYLHVPDDMENAIVSGTPPFDGVDAIFISHFHRDHFSPTLLLNCLVLNENLLVFAPEQAVAAIRRFASGDDPGSGR